MGVDERIFRPEQVGALALDEIIRCRDTKTSAISLGWPTICQQVKPLRPGKLCTVQAYTSNYKTGFMTYWARKLAENIRANNEEGRAVVYVSWEDTVEDMGLFDLAHSTRIDASRLMDGEITDTEIEQLKHAADERARLNLWIIGDTVGGGKARPRMTMSFVEEGLEWILRRTEFRPVAVFLDYLNLIAPEKASAWSDNRRMDIMELTYRARSLGLDQGCPVVLAVQSKRESNERVWKLPQKWDALEASAIEQYSDTMLSLWLPATTEPITTPPLKLKGPDGEPTDIEITRNLLIMGVNKQKKGPAGGWYALYVDPTRNVIEPLERRAASAPPVYGGRDDAFDLG